MKVFKYILFTILFLLFFGLEHYYPLIQHAIPSLQARDLGGSRLPDKRPMLWPWAWMDGSFQSKYQNYLKNGSVLSPTAIRYYAQLNYSLFGELPHENIMLGENNNLYTLRSWRASQGLDYMKDEDIKYQIDNLKGIHEYLTANGKKLLVLIPPNKSTGFKAELKPYYKNYPGKKTNRLKFSEQIQAMGLPIIDFSNIINTEEDHEYALYPQGGLHWTYYGNAIAADSIRNYLSANFALELPRMEWQDSIELSEWQFFTDRELYAGANLMSEPTLDLLPYPQIKYLSDTTNQVRVLAVGDSYYKLFYDYGIHQGLFHSASQFWYYASTLFPKQNVNGKQLSNSSTLKILEVLEDMDLVILTVMEDNLGTFGWGWQERVLKEIEAQ